MIIQITEESTLITEDNGTKLLKVIKIDKNRFYVIDFINKNNTCYCNISKVNQLKQGLYARG